MESQFAHHLDKLKKRLHNSRVNIVNLIDNVVDHINLFEVQAELLSDTEFQNKIFALFEEIKSIEPLKKVCHSHRETFAFIGRLGKEIEAEFPFNLEDLNTDKAESLNSDLVNQVISDYLISQGLYDQANLLIENCCNKTEDLIKFHTIIKHLEKSEFDEALSLIQDLGEKGSELEFSLHKCNFIKILVKKNASEAMDYGRVYLQKFADSHLEEIKELMCACLFANKPEDSPYKYMFTEGYTKEIIREMLEKWAIISGLPATSPLQTVVRTGDQVIPELIPLTQMAGHKFWTAPIPTELKLTADLVFHSTFVCPVSKEVASPNNPPIMLPCGHLIAKQSMEKLLSNSLRGKFKCPTCPTEVTEKDTKKLII